MNSDCNKIPRRAVLAMGMGAALPASARKPYGPVRMTPPTERQSPRSR